MDLNYIEKWLTEASVKYKDGSPAVNLGLIITVFFKDGHTLEVRRKMAECADRFYTEFKTHLKKTQVKKWHRITEKNYQQKRMELINLTEEQIFCWHLTGAKELYLAPDYDLFMMNQRISNNETDRTVIKLTFPLSFIKEPGGLDCYQQWILWLCNTFCVENGYAGLSFALPVGFLESHDIFPWEYAKAKRFPGIMVDSYAHFEGDYAACEIKSACWYTILGRPWIDKLGGEHYLQQKIAKEPDIKLLPYNSGIILKAGTLPPHLGEVNSEELPTLLVKINWIIKSIRKNKVRSLHLYAPKKYSQFDEETSMVWFARFDDASALLDKDEPGK